MGERAPERAILDMLPDDGRGPVFDEPWQARIFALVARLTMDGHCAWDDFKALLIDEIRERGAPDGSDYYRRWLAAAERLTAQTGMASGEALDARKAHLARHPPHPTAARPSPIAVFPARKA